MKQVKKIALFIITTSLLFSCHSKYEDSNATYSEKSEAITSTDNVSEQEIVNGALKNRKYIKTASISAKVKDVSTFTISTEQWIDGKNGIILNSDTRKEIVNSNEVQYKSDSTKKIDRVAVAGTLLVRIPTIYLDSLLAFVQSSAEFVPSRNIALEDASLSLLHNKLAQENTISDQIINKANAKSKSTDDELNIAVIKQDAKANSINLKMDQLTISDKINYSDVTINLSQNDIIITSISPNIPKLMAPNYWYEIKNSLSFGILIIKKLSLIAFSIWPIIISGLAVGLWLWKRSKAKRIAA